jgi:hypothetical protein
VNHPYNKQQTEKCVFGFLVISEPVAIDVSLFSYGSLTMECFTHKTKKDVTLQNPIPFFLLS